MACDPQTLVQNANCLECGIPRGMQWAVLIYLAAVKAGASTNPQSLMDNAKCYTCIPPGMRMAVLISLACQMATKQGL